MSKDELYSSLSRRERQIMDVLFARQRATAAEVREGLAEPPSYSAVRAMLRILEEKGHVLHEQDGAAYVYRPAHATQEVRRSAVRRLVDTFFGGKIERAMVALLEEEDAHLSATEKKRILAMIKRAEKEGR
jgi:predicted transcriptional regulator